MTVDFNFATKLILQVIFENLGFVEYFERNQEFALFFSGQIHVTKFASTQRLSDLKVFNAPLFRIEKLIPRL